MGVEEQLPSGFVTAVVRVGDTVRRPPSSAYVRRLLRHLAERGWPGAPRLLGVDADGREVLTFLAGHVAWEPVQPTAVGSEASLAAAARLVRELHDLTAGTELAAGAEVACHHDLSPRNTVYRDLGDGLRPVAFLDWDLAGPGRRVDDLAHACWQFVGLGPGLADPADAARRVRVMADAYGPVDRAGLVPAILAWQDRCWRGIDAEADAGDPAKARLRAAGVVAGVRAAYEWTAAHRDVLALS